MWRVDGEGQGQAVSGYSGKRNACPPVVAFDYPEDRFRADYTTVKSTKVSAPHNHERIMPNERVMLDDPAQVRKPDGPLGSIEWLLVERRTTRDV